LNKIVHTFESKLLNELKLLIMAKKLDESVPIVGPKSPSRRPPVDNKVGPASKVIASKAVKQPVVAKRGQVKK